MMKREIESLRDDAAGLEQLYRQTLAGSDDASAFKEAIAQCAEEHPDNVLYRAWVCRLEDQPDASGQVDAAGKQDQLRQWRIAIASSAGLGILYALFANGKPPAPVPGEAEPLFWIGWGPVTALGILFYLAAVDRTGNHIRRYGGLAAALLLITVYTALTGWNRTDDIAILLTLHLPFVAWAAVGVGLSFGYPDPVKQCYAFLVKSVETFVNGGIYFGAGAVFLGLTIGIFNVLGIRLAPEGVLTVAAWGIGAIPILVLASVYNPTAAPVAQNWTTGLARIIRILTRLVLPPALGVLAVYVCWFIPVYFWRPFEERDVLIVYNATIMAILVLLTAVVAGPDEDRSPQQDTVLRIAVLALAVLTLLLNAYALAAVAGRTFEFGLTPNRYAVLGWNIVTLIMLAVIVIRVWKTRTTQWVLVFRDAIAYVSAPAVAWAIWVVVVLPLSFD